jgi:hypothetical protein
MGDRLQRPIRVTHETHHPNADPGVTVRGRRPFSIIGALSRIVSVVLFSAIAAVPHAMKVEGAKTGDGFKVSSARILDASMLPMALQGFAGDCLIKKAVDIAPMAD